MGSTSLWVTEVSKSTGLFLVLWLVAFPSCPWVWCCFTVWYICLTLQTPLSAVSKSCQMNCLVHNSAVDHGGGTTRLQVLEGHLSSLGNSLWQVELMVGKRAFICTPEWEWSHWNVVGIIQCTSLCMCRLPLNILAGASDFNVSFGSLVPLRFLGHGNYTMSTSTHWKYHYPVKWGTGRGKLHLWKSKAKNRRKANHEPSHRKRGIIAAKFWSCQFFTLGLVAEERNVLQMQGITRHILDFSAFLSPGREGGSDH